MTNLILLAQDAVGASEAADFAARELSGPALSSFQGGFIATGFWTAMIVLCVVICAVYFWIIEPSRYGGR